MATMQGLEQTTIEVAPGGALPSERSVVKSQLWKENAEKFLKGEPKVLGVVQVLIALINLILGIIIMTEIIDVRSAFSVYIYAPVWGSIVGVLSLMLIFSVLELGLATLAAMLWWKEGHSDLSQNVIFLSRNTNNESSMESKSLCNPVYEQ